MPIINVDLDKIPTPGYPIMCCPNCGYKVVPSYFTYCGKCGSDFVPSSFYEWDLYDALRIELKKKSVKPEMKHQYPVYTPRGSPLHYDIYVWVDGKSPTGGCGYLIEVNGPEHYTKYGRIKDRRKQLIALSNHLRPGTAFREVRNDECTKDRVRKTARKIVKELIDRANVG